jgi:outer membrane protein
MRSWLWGLGLFVFLVAAPAQAQFANRSLGLSIGYAKLFADGLDWAVPFSLEGSYYIEDGFEITASFAVVYLTILAAHPPGAIGLFPAIGFRYLFLQETIRPYIGADIAYMHIFSGDITSVDRVGLGPKVGVEFFTSENFSLGLKADAAFYFALGTNLTTRLQFSGTMNVYF